MVWLASELMFFSGLFGAYFTLRAEADGPWPPDDVELYRGKRVTPDAGAAAW